MTIIPFLIAWGLKDHADLLKNHTNNGTLITPAITTERHDLIGMDAFSATHIAELAGHWLIVNVIPDARCNAVCLDALLKTRQLRLMLNKDLSRTRRVVIVFNDVAPETASQWWLKDTLLGRLRGAESSGDAALFLSLQLEENKLDEALVAKLVGDENRQFALRSDLIRVRPSAALAEKLMGISKGKILDGMLYVMDPLGNLMMQYEPGFDPYKVKSDLMQLLRISQIG
ncbi:MAG: hypothetical protein Q7U57_15730 [Methylovulum sp.]|nr:hypothetical protein [Methylovulum sp.]